MEKLISVTQLLYLWNGCCKFQSECGLRWRIVLARKSSHQSHVRVGVGMKNQLISTNSYGYDWALELTNCCVVYFDLCQTRMCLCCVMHCHTYLTILMICFNRVVNTFQIIRLPAVCGDMVLMS